MDVPVKAILWSPTQDYVGFCDRLRGIAAGAVFAEELGAKLFVRWNPCEPCPVDFLDVFEESDYFSTRWEREDYEILHEWDFAINEMPLNLGGKLRSVESPKELRIDLADEHIMKRWAEILCSLKPLPAISEKIAVIRANADRERMLGVHLRRTDVLYCNSRDITQENVRQYDEALWSRIVLAVEGGDFDHVYLASDDQAYFQGWREKLSKLPVKLHHNTANWGADLRQTPLEDLVVDLYLLSSCHKVYGSTWSSIFFVGGALGGKFEVISPPEPLSQLLDPEIMKFGGNDADAISVESKGSKEFSTKRVGLSAITVSVNYRDYLARILENRAHFDEWIIVTTPDDLETQDLCARHDLKCLVTEVFYSKGASFNKAKGLNLALQEVNPGNWIVSLDSDILLPRDFRKRLDEEFLDPHLLYGLEGRCICRDPKTLATLKATGAWDALVLEEHPWILGYFQMFHPENRYARKFDEMVSSNASAYDDQFAKDFGPKNWHFLEMTALHLGEVYTNWNGRSVSEIEDGHGVDWAEAGQEVAFSTILGELNRDQGASPRVLQVKYGESRLDEEVQEFAGEVTEYDLDDSALNWRALGQEGGEEYDLIVLSSALKAVDFHPIFRNILPFLKAGGAIIAPFFDASKWPEWTAMLALRLGLPERVREDGWCLIRSEPAVIGQNFSDPLDSSSPDQSDLTDEEVILLPVSPGFVAKAALALHSLRKYWRGRIRLAVPRDLQGPWERIAATYQAELMRVDLPRAAEWDDQWGREAERFSLVTAKGLLGLLEKKVMVWHPEAICLGSPDPLFAELRAGEIFYVYCVAEGGTAGEKQKIYQRVVTGSKEILLGCEARLIEGLEVASSLLRFRRIKKTENLFETLSRGVERLLRGKCFRSVLDFGPDELASEDLRGLIFPSGSEAAEKEICEEWAEIEDEVAKSSSCEISAVSGTTIAVRVDPGSLACFYFNFRHWHLPASIPVHVFFEGVSEDDFFFLEDETKIHLHDLDSERYASGTWIEHAAALVDAGRLALISPKWKPRPGASLLWPESWGDFEISGSHSEVEIGIEELNVLEDWAEKWTEEDGILNKGGDRWGKGIRSLKLRCLDSEFAVFEVDFLRGVLGKSHDYPTPNPDAMLLIWYLVTRGGGRIQNASLERLGWVIEDQSIESEASEMGENDEDGDLDLGDPVAEGRVSFITLSNEGYLDYTLNSVLSLRMLGERGSRLAERLVCYSVGRECHESLQAAGCRSVLIDDEEHSGFQVFRQGAWAGIVKHKFDAISRELLKREFVCFADGDIVFESTDFLNDCAERMIREDVELVIQNDTGSYQDEDHAMLCSGFMMIRSTPNTREAFSVETVLPAVDEDFCDQLYLNAVIRHSVKTSVLPLELYPNGSYFQKFGPSPKAKIYHFNYLVGHQKRGEMVKAGKWYL
jgi:hypothetical protein